MPSFKASFFLLTVLFTTVLLMSCGEPKEPPSNIDISNTDGKTELAKRLAKTNEVKDQLNQIIDAMKPASVLLSDLAEAVKKEEVTDGINKSHVQSILDLAQRILKEITEGFVQQLPDGSWLIERSLKLPGLAPEYLCPTAKLYLRGKREADIEGLRLQVSGCSLETTTPIDLAFIGIDPSKQILTHFHLDRISNLFSQQKLMGDSCLVKVQNSSVELNCKPLTVNAGKIKIFVEPLYFFSNSSGITARINLVVRETQNLKFVVRATLDARPGEATKFDVSTKE